MNKNPFKRKKELKFETNEGRKSKNKKIFMSLFIVFIILLSSVSVLYLLKTYDYDLSKAFGKKEETSETDDKPKTELKGKATFLFAVTSQKNDDLHFISIVKADMDKVKVSVTCLPTDKVISSSGSSQTLKTKYINGGAKELVSGVTSYTGIEIDRYIIVNEKKFKTFVARLGNYKITMEESVSYNEGDFSINLVKGTQTLTGDRLLNYIIYQKKNGGAYLNAQALIICDMIDQMVSSKNFNEEDNMYDRLINLMDTNISIVDYTRNKKVILAYIDSDKRKKSVNVDVSTLKK